MVLEPAVLAWLLDADVALRWQVERDLVGAPQEVWVSLVPESPRTGGGSAWRCSARGSRAGRP
ncbi:MAG: hypothetical protein ACRDUW_24295 [Pseudonocardiaceae bacterium]